MERISSGAGVVEGLRHQCDDLEEGLFQTDCRLIFILVLKTLK